MSAKTNGVKWSKSSKAKERRKRTIKRLKAQLEWGHKNAKNSAEFQGDVPLTDQDRARIQKEIETLESRI